MRIGIYGGSFNPIHLAHLHVADCAARDMMLDKVLFVPAYDPYTKDQTNMASYFSRCVMTSKAIKDDPRFSFVHDPSRQLGNHSYTIDVVREVRKQIMAKRRGTNNQIVLIVGEDSFLSMPKWYEFEEILRNIDAIYVVPRQGNTSPEFIKENFPGINVTFSKHGDIPISSTMIRKLLASREPCRYLLPPTLYDYISDECLYETED